MNLRARIGARLQELRQAKGLTQQEMAGLADLDPPALSKIEAGRRNLTIRLLGQLLAALGIAPRDFFASDDFAILEGSVDSELESDSLSFEQHGSALRVAFPCGKHDATVDFEGMQVGPALDAIRLLREGLHRAELSPSTGVVERDERALMSAAIVGPFLRLAYEYPRTNPSNLWRYIIYRAFLDPLNHPSAHQGKDFGASWKRTSGWALEQVLDLHYGKLLASHDLRITSYRSNADRAPLLELMGLTGKVNPDKVDQFLIGTKAGHLVPVGAIHLKGSIAERRDDDAPASRVLREAGFLSLFVTMDVKDTPGVRPNNRGDYGRPGPAASAKRLDVENRGVFSAVFSFNANTIESPFKTPSGCRIMTIDFSNPDDQFSRYVVRSWKSFKKSR